MTATDVQTTRFELGDVVEELMPDPPGDQRKRGVVIWAHGDGWYGVHRKPTSDDIYIIMLSTGQQVGTYYPDGWKVIPRDERSRVERVESVLWGPAPDVVDSERPQDHETREWHLLMALMGPAEEDRLLVSDWLSWDELWVHMAEYIDDRLRWARRRPR